jgi:hypothetical protein
VLTDLVSILSPLPSGKKRRVLLDPVGPLLTLTVEGCDRLIQLVHVPYDTSPAKVVCDFDTPLAGVAMAAPAVGAAVEVTTTVEALFSMHTGVVRRWDFVTIRATERAKKYRHRGFKLSEGVGRILRYQYPPTKPLPGGWEEVKWEAMDKDPIGCLLELHEQGRTREWGPSPSF